MPYADPEMKRARNRRYYLANRERLLAAAAEWQRTHPDAHREAVAKHGAKPEVKARAAARYQENRADRDARARASREAHPEARRETQRKQDQKPETRRRHSDRQAARRAMVTTIVERKKVWQRDEGLCGTCGLFADPGNWHLDHIVPLARGGEHSYSNTQVSHPRCNLSKGARVYP